MCEQQPGLPRLAIGTSNEGQVSTSPLARLVLADVLLGDDLGLFTLPLPPLFPPLGLGLELDVRGRVAAREFG